MSYFRIIGWDYLLWKVEYFAPPFLHHCAHWYTKRSTMCVAEDSVLAQQCNKWTEQGFNCTQGLDAQWCEKLGQKHWRRSGCRHHFVQEQNHWSIASLIESWWIEDYVHEKSWDLCQFMKKIETLKQVGSWLNTVHIASLVRAPCQITLWVAEAEVRESVEVLLSRWCCSECCRIFDRCSG